MNSANSLSWQWQTPIKTRYNWNYTEDNWLEELSEMRGKILFDNGRRPAFKIRNGKFADPDIIDTYAYHLLARSSNYIVGCIRLLPLVSSPTSMTKSFLEDSTLEQILQTIGSTYSQTCEGSRWIVHPDFRGTRISLGLVAGIIAVANHLNFQTMIAMAGTRDRQDRYLKHIGFKPLPDIPLLKVPELDDELRIVYYDLSQPPNSLLAKWHDRMTKLVKVQIGEDAINPGRMQLQSTILGL